MSIADSISFVAYFGSQHFFFNSQHWIALWVLQNFDSSFDKKCPILKLSSIEEAFKSWDISNYLYKARDLNSSVWHPVNVASVLLIGRPKRDQWQLTKTLGSLGFYISWFLFDPWLCLALAWKKKRVFYWCFQWKNYSLLHFRIILGHLKNVHQFIHFHEFCLKISWQSFPWPLVINN